MCLLSRLFTPRLLQKARRALRPSWVLEGAIVRSARKSRRRRRAPRQTSPVYETQIRDRSTGWTWNCPHNHTTQESAYRCADAMEERINRLGWERATAGGK